MIRKRRNNRENTDLLELIHGTDNPIITAVILLGIVEERVVVVIDIVDADLEDALPLAVFVRLDELHPDVEVVEGLHAEVVLIAVVFNVGVVVLVVLRRGGVF